MIGWTEEKWIEVFDRWLERTARYEAALRAIAGAGAEFGQARSAVIAMKALEDE